MRSFKLEASTMCRAGPSCSINGWPKTALDIGMNTQHDHVDISHMTTFAEVSRRHAIDRPDSIALSFEARETTFARFERHSNQVANALIAAGVAPGDRVAYF